MWVRSGKEWRLLGDAAAALALPPVFLTGLQVCTIHRLHLSNHVFQTSAIADVEPVTAAGPFQLAHAEFVRLGYPVLLPDLWSGTPEPMPIEWASRLSGLTVVSGVRNLCLWFSLSLAATFGFWF